MRDTEQILALIGQYAESVNALDLDLARSLWLDAPDVSFIHPRGHETGRDNIVASFYLDTMGRFSARALVPRDISVSLHGDTALAVFYWDFHAEFADGGDRADTHGRETQVYVRRDGAWRLLHVHYSGMPVTGDREGF